MRKLVAFNQITVDGYFAGANGDLSWAKDNRDPEFRKFVEGRVVSSGVHTSGC